MRIKNTYLTLFALFLLASFSGCGNGFLPLGGKVTFSDDGSPLTVGTVCFESETSFSRAPLDANGRYVVGSLKDKDGIPPGTYNVYVALPRDSGVIDPKFTGRLTSGLTFNVDGANKQFDFTVDRYTGPPIKQLDPTKMRKR